MPRKSLLARRTAVALSLALLSVPCSDVGGQEPSQFYGAMGVANPSAPVRIAEADWGSRPVRSGQPYRIAKPGDVGTGAHGVPAATAGPSSQATIRSPQQLFAAFRMLTDDGESVLVDEPEELPAPVQSQNPVQSQSPVQPQSPAKRQSDDRSLNSATPNGHNPILPAPNTRAPNTRAPEARAPAVHTPHLHSPIVQTPSYPAPLAAAHGVAMEANAVQLNLPSAMAMIGGDHPVVGLAQWRVQEAYAKVARAKALWLPSIQAGFSFHRHDGNYQASDGTIVDVNRNSYQGGLGTGATGAGTTPQPGLVAQFHFADAIFRPKVERQSACAHEHAVKAVFNRQLLGVASEYTELVAAHQDVQILQASRNRIAELTKITTDFAEAGQGLQSDSDRLKTELALVDSRLIAGRERIAVASARLAQTLSIRNDGPIMPMDINALPLELLTGPSNKASLIGTGLATRPELRESQALVAAACQAHKRERYAPFVPSVLLGYSTGGFGGGLGNNLKDVSGRYDFDAMMTWQVRNMGLGEKAARREAAARVQQAKYQKLQVMDQVASEISEAYSQVVLRSQQIVLTQTAITSAQTSYQSNLARIKDGEGLPIEVLQAVQALEAARRAYLAAVIDHNQSQFRLQWALGWPVHG